MFLKISLVFLAIGVVGTILMTVAQRYYKKSSEYAYDMIMGVERDFSPVYRFFLYLFVIGLILLIIYLIL